MKKAVLVCLVLFVSMKMCESQTVASDFFTMSAIYPAEVMDAYTSGDAYKTITLLNANLASFEKRNSTDFFALANYRFFLAHLLDLVEKHADAIPHYQKADEYLAKARFIPSEIDSVVSAKSKDSRESQEPGFKEFQTKLSHQTDWQKLRRAYLNYTELGLKGDDASSMAKGVQLIKEIGNSDFVRLKKFYNLEKTSRTILNNSVTFEVQALNPNLTYPRIECHLPFLLNDVQTFLVTVKNTSNTLVTLNSDDMVLKAGLDSLKSISDEDISNCISNSVSSEQFIYCELSPFTFSSNPETFFNAEIRDANIKAKAKIEEEKKRALKAEVEAQIAADQQRKANFAMSMLQAAENMDNASNERNAQYAAQQARNSANDARSKGDRNSYTYYNSQANSAQLEYEMIKSSNADASRYEQADQARRQQQVSALQADARSKNSAAAQAAINAGAIGEKSWSKSTGNYAIYFESIQAQERTYTKLQPFAISSMFLPRRGAAIKKSEQGMTMGELMAAAKTNSASNGHLNEDLGPAIRIKPGESWTGIICFDTKTFKPGALDKAGALSIGYRIEHKKSSFAVDLAPKSTYVFYPPAVDYRQHFVINSPRWGNLDLESGDYGWGYSFNWYVLMPELLLNPEWK